MSRFIRIPLFFLFIGSMLGVFLRWQFLVPTPGITYSYFLHAHSHVLFLGWIFNVLYIGFTTEHIEKEDHNFFINLFSGLQVFVGAMLISFPFEGYGFYSILFSTLHTIGAIVFIARYIVKTKNAKQISAWYARTALLFFLISTAGPFSLGYLMSNDLGSGNWYNFSIYFYLHFQYNGFFLFGVLSLFFNLLEKKKINFSMNQAKTCGVILMVTCVSGYVLSILWAKPGTIFNIIGALTALVQCAGFAVLLKLIYEIRHELTGKFKSHSLVLLSVALFCFAIKLILQTISAFPSIAQIAYEHRAVVIAYLHLVLVGLISSFLFAWYIENGFMKERWIKRAIPIFLISFTGMELCLVFTPLWSSIVKWTTFQASEFTFIFSSVLLLSFFLFLYSSFISASGKNQSLS